jgi:hypothetical protein
MERMNFLEMAKVEFFHDYDNLPSDGTKSEGFNIIRNLDFMGFHYFGQEMDVVKRASFYAIVSITQNGIKHFIGFVGVSTPTLDKIIRNQILGARFLPCFYQIKKENPEEFEEMRFWNLSRIVFLPSFRGLGLNKFAQQSVIDFLSKDPNMYMLEISSMMLHTFDFLPDSFNKSFISLKDMTYFDTGGKAAVTAKGYKANTSNIATTATHYFVENEKPLKTLQTYFKRTLGLDIELSDLKEIMNKTVDVDSYSVEDIKFLKKNKIAIVLLHLYDMDFLKTLKFQTLVPKRPKKEKDVK